MRRFSLTARLATWFALITVLVFGVGGGVLLRRVVTATDVAAGDAAAQVQPPAAARRALRASGAGRGHLGSHEWFGHNSSSISAASRRRKATPRKIAK